MPVFVSSVGIGRFGKRPEGLEELLVDAARKAMESIPSGSRHPEALFVGSMLAGTVGGVESLVPRLASRLELDGIPGFRIESASASGAAVFQAAVHAVASGAFDNALVLGGDKMTSLPSDSVTSALARSLSNAEVANGATMPSMAALVTSAYLARYHMPMERMGEVTVQNREHASRNPSAHFQKAVSLDEVNASRTVSSPLRLLHVSPMSDGAAAVIISRSEGRVRARGLGQATDRIEVALRAELTSFSATRKAAQRAYEMAQLTRKEVQVAELHDAFAPFEVINIEDVGFCGPGEGLPWLESGKGNMNGVLPVNPSGGLLGRGHPVGASGLVQIAELYRQLVGEAGPLQAGHPRVGLAQSVGGLGSHNFVTLLERS